MKTKSSLMENVEAMFASIMIPLALGIALLIYFFVLGNPANFEGGVSNEGHPINNLGIVFKGGLVVPVIISTLLIVIIFSLERFLTLAKSSGKMRGDKFVRIVKNHLDEGSAAKAIAACDAQKGSVANVVKSVLKKYEEIESDPEASKEQKVLSIQKEVEEATTIEIPMLQKNLIILSTVASIATLLGLLGTVFGMITAFKALAAAGAPDALALANGISEALINTAFGIGTSAIAIVMYNFFNTKIEKLTYNMDEVGFIITQTFAANYPNKRLAHK